MKKADIKAAAARYLKIVEWSDEDKCFIGRCPGLFDGGVHGSDEVEVFRELTAAAEEWVETLIGDEKALPPATAGKKYSGKFLVRVAPSLHEKLAIRAMIQKESLNRLVERRLAEA